MSEQEKVQAEEAEVESREGDETEEPEVELHGGGKHQLPVPPAGA